MGKDYIKQVKDIYFYDNKFHSDLDIYYDKSVYDESIRKSNIFKRWYDMHYRCYSVKLHERFPSYTRCSVCDEWKSFGNFYKWYQEHYYEISDQKMDLDKDILFKDNKVYSPDTCIFVPHEINTMFINSKNNRGKYPLGVWFDNDKQKFRASIGTKKLGTFKTPKLAFVVYKREKEKQIKELARKYKEQMPDNLYQAMIHWKVEITD